MKAAVYERYGPPEVVEIKEVPRPIPADDALLIKTYAASITSGDWRAHNDRTKWFWPDPSSCLWSIPPAPQGIGH